MTVRDLVRRAADELAAAGVPSPRHDAEVLAAHVLGVPRGRLVLAGAAAVDDATHDALDALVRRRADRQPLQHLMGSAPFRYLDLAVGPGVFVPRPETESVAGWVVTALRAAGHHAPLVVDLCTGSGAIALAVATEVPGAVVHAVDLDATALAYARRNVEAHADALRVVGSRVLLHLADATRALPSLDGTVATVVANPPYLPLGSPLEPEVREHDPALALFGGADGLAGPRAVVAAATRLLRPGGVLAVEHDTAQGVQVAQLLRGPGHWQDVRLHEDLAGRPRWTTAQRGAEEPPAGRTG